MTSPPPNKDDPGSSCSWYQPSAEASQSPSAPAAMSAPSLALWSRKLALQSEGLAALLQSCSTKLHSQQSELQELLNSCKADIAAASKAAEAAAKQRDSEIDSHLIVVRRVSQTVSDVVGALDAKLSVLDTLHALHRKLQAHDLLFRELAAGQEALAAAHGKMAAAQEAQMKDVRRVLDRLERDRGRVPGSPHGRGIVLGEEIAVKDSQPQLAPPRPKRPRRLLSDEESPPVSAHRQLSLELLPFESAKEARAGSKRKLLSTMDLAQFTADDF